VRLEVAPFAVGNAERQPVGRSQSGGWTSKRLDPHEHLLLDVTVTGVRRRNVTLEEVRFGGRGGVAALWCRRVDQQRTPPGLATAPLASQQYDGGGMLNVANGPEF
jgi:hypothetical protein